ncbi:hypothetical protein FRUB_04218 [Fimbriiglobus ruber]|uniref:Uncharacterized protein n=1 Tax=Fimbriiglobus ruber TaxID=1908690 RepID=A0A225DKX9_9BACT|nr:hypothetical protein FRUB_04218 [Fimbriiglobus ruber]
MCAICIRHQCVRIFHAEVISRPWLMSVAPKSGFSPAATCGDPYARFACPSTPPQHPNIAIPASVMQPIPAIVIAVAAERVACDGTHAEHGPEASHKSHISHRSQTHCATLTI